MTDDIKPPNAQTKTQMLLLPNVAYTIENICPETTNPKEPADISLADLVLYVLIICGIVQTK
jgi:hypothetical protein